MQNMKMKNTNRKHEGLDIDCDHGFGCDDTLLLGLFGFSFVVLGDSLGLEGLGGGVFLIVGSEEVHIIIILFLALSSGRGSNLCLANATKLALITLNMVPPSQSVHELSIRCSTDGFEHGNVLTANVPASDVRLVQKKVVKLVEVGFSSKLCGHFLWKKEIR